jgi:hypothetical protein
MLPSDRMAVTVVVIHEEAYPNAPPMPFPEIWKSRRHRNSSMLKLLYHLPNEEWLDTGGQVRAHIGLTGQEPA